MKRHDKAPNGHFAEGLILYGNLETGAMASQGFLLEPPDLQHASIGLQNDYQDKLRIFLSTLGDCTREALKGSGAGRPTKTRSSVPILLLGVWDSAPPFGKQL